MKSVLCLLCSCLASTVAPAAETTPAIQATTTVNVLKDFDVHHEKRPYLVVAAISPLASLAAPKARATARDPMN